MRIFIASLQSVSRYSQSRSYEREVPREDKELHDDYEKRTWRFRTHALADGRIFIPPTSFKEAIAAAAQYLGMQIPGKGRRTYTKHFLSGVIVAEGPTLSITRDQVEGEWLYLNADGRKGGKTRVWRCMPMIPEWKADVGFHVLDDTLTEEVFRYHLEQAGAFIGIGRFRPQNGGFYGRFAVTDLVTAT